MSTSQSIHVLDRAMAILNALEHQPLGLSLGGLASATGMPRSTVQRVVDALKSHQMLMAGPHGVRLGPALARLASASKLDFLTIIAPLLERLNRSTGEAVAVCALRDACAVVVAFYPATHMLGVSMAVGDRYPSHCTAAGQILLSSLPDAERTNVIAASLARAGTADATTAADWSVCARQAGEAGWALAREAYAPGVCTLAAGIASDPTQRYALVLAVPKERFETQLQHLKDALSACQQDIRQWMTG
ncbi:IclR family transcriptional regulator [Pseudomonas sp. TE3610]